VNDARLILTCGLPGAGKTTLAHRLAEDRGAVRLTKDEWLWALGSSPWDQAIQEKLESELWNLAQQVLLLGLSVVLDFGLWARIERDEMRCAARRLGVGVGVGVELHYLEVPIDELWRRIESRNSKPPWDSEPIRRSHLDEWANLFEVPDADEFALFDSPPHSN
jgi:predicted kinase